jgi:hypothetical protein
MYDDKLCNLVVSLFCFALCAWTAGMVKPGLDMAKALKGPATATSPGHDDEESEAGGYIAAAVLFGLAGAVSFVGVFMNKRK